MIRTNEELTRYAQRCEAQRYGRAVARALAQLASEGRGRALARLARASARWRERFAQSEALALIDDDAAKRAREETLVERGAREERERALRDRLETSRALFELARKHGREHEARARRYEARLQEGLARQARRMADEAHERAAWALENSEELARQLAALAPGASAFLARAEHAISTGAAGDFAHEEIRRSDAKRAERANSGEGR